MDNVRDQFKQWAVDHEKDPASHEEWNLFESIWKLRDDEICILKGQLDYLRGIVRHEQH